MCFVDEFVFVGYVAPGVLSPDYVEGVGFEGYVECITEFVGYFIGEVSLLGSFDGFIDHVLCGVKTGDGAAIFGGELSCGSAKGTADIEDMVLFLYMCFFGEMECFLIAADMDLFAHEHFPENADGSGVDLVYIFDGEI